jgi:hypothetical protein
VGTGVGALTGLVVWLAGDDECTGDDPLNLCEDLGEVVRALEMAAYSAAGTVVGGAIGAALSMRERWANVGMLMPAVTASGTPGLVWRGQLPF